MDEEPKTNEESWSVEPPKKRGNMALRIGLLVAALATAVVAGILLYGDNHRSAGIIINNPSPWVDENAPVSMRLNEVDRAEGGDECVADQSLCGNDPE